jgi:hypothetical protein
MSGNLNRRVSRLENESGEGKRFLVVHLYPGESREAAIKRARIEPVDNNTILFITCISRNPGDPPLGQDGEPKCQVN